MPRFPLTRRLAYALMSTWGFLCGAHAVAAEANVMCPVEAEAATHSWSPDSRRLVFATPDDEIKILSARFGKANPMSTEAISGHPVWSPKAERVAILRSEGAEDSDLAYASLYIWDGSGASSVRVLASGLSTHLVPVWSPDGTRLLAQSSDDDLVTVNAATGDKKLVYDRENGNPVGLKGTPAWVSNSEVIYQVGAGALFIANVDTGAVKRFKGPGPYVAFQAQANGDIWALVIVDKKPQLTLLHDGKVIRTIEAPIKSFSGPNSAGKIAAQMYSNGGLRLIDITTGAITALTQNDSDAAPVLSPDGRAVGFSRQDPVTEVMQLCVATLP
jgi:dipeptidyl aminopeptidase/acylaminoacyl peptidase